VLKKILFPGKYIQGAGPFAELPALVKLFGRAALFSLHPPHTGRFSAERHRSRRVLFARRTICGRVL